MGDLPSWTRIWEARWASILGSEEPVGWNMGCFLVVKVLRGIVCKIGGRFIDLL